ncbi:hypothetical protein CBL_07895 [Carabus blaptoides fortunei]
MAHKKALKKSDFRIAQDAESNRSLERALRDGVSIVRGTYFLQPPRNKLQILHHAGSKLRRVVALSTQNDPPDRENEATYSSDLHAEEEDGNQGNIDESVCVFAKVIEIQQAASRPPRCNVELKRPNVRQRNEIASGSDYRRERWYGRQNEERTSK